MRKYESDATMRNFHHRTKVCVVCGESAQIGHVLCPDHMKEWEAFGHMPPLHAWVNRQIDRIDLLSTNPCAACPNRTTTDDYLCEPCRKMKP